MYADNDDDSFDQMVDEEIAEDQVDDRSEVYENPPEENAQLLKELGFFEVTCKSGCGTFPLEEAEVLSVDSHQGTATFRCRMCNDIQTAELLIVD